MSDQHAVSDPSIAIPGAVSSDPTTLLDDLVAEPIQASIPADAGAQTEKTAVLLVILFIGVFGLAGLYFTYDLIRTHTDAAAVAVVSGLTGTALGSIGTLLASTRSRG